MPSLRENRVKRKLERGEVASVVSGLMTSDLVDMLGPLGFDGVWIEIEHGPIDFADIPDLTRAADLWGMTSVVRVNQNVPGVIYRTFDVGAQGVVVPHVNTAAEARAVVDAGKFAPLGARSMATVWPRACPPRVASNMWPANNAAPGKSPPQPSSDGAHTSIAAMAVPWLAAPGRRRSLMNDR